MIGKMVAGRRAMMGAGLYWQTVLVIVLMCPLCAAGAEDGPASGALDGRVFVGLVGPQGALDFDEELHFNEGMMWSRRCVLCGFQPAPYWTRRVGAAIEFRGVLKSQSGSVFDYLGIVNNGDIQVRIRWTKDRWYWSIDRTLVFKGQIDGTRSPVSAPVAAIGARDALNYDLPVWCP